MTLELPDDVHAQITLLSKQGDEFAEQDRAEEALLCYEQAWTLLPEPREQWSAATWLLTAKGDALFLAGRFHAALAPLESAVRCPDGLGNPFIHLRLGQVQLELGNTERAKDELARAFMGGGDEIFEGDDPKYWRFIREILLPPVDEVGE
jgi:tetratricopeptide (TPR) repeat protein